MFESSQIPTGTSYTTTTTLLFLAVVFTPAMLLFSMPTGIVNLLLAAAGSLTFLALAWANWKKMSQLTIPSISARRGDAK